MNEGDRLIQLHEVVGRVSLRQPQIYYWMRNGTFPPARYLGGGLVAWLERDITEWIAGRKSWVPDGPDNRERPVEHDAMVVAVAPLTLTRDEALTYTGLAPKLFNELERGGSITGKNIGRNGRRMYLRSQLDDVVARFFAGPESWHDIDFEIN